VRVGGYGTNQYGYCVAVRTNYAYACIGPEFAVIDVTDPANPARAGGVPATGSEIALSGDYALLANGSSGFTVVDIRDPANPFIAGTYETPGSAESIAASGNYAYVADGSWGLQVFRIDPIPRYRLTAQRLGNDLLLKWPQAAGNYVLQSASNPTAPQWLAVTGTPQLQNGFYQLNVPINARSTFFRLRGP
jgi:hypothetical protein